MHATVEDVRMSDLNRNPGMSASKALVVVCDDRGILADDGNAAPVPWWSVTKTALAACALVLVARGRLSLDSRVPDRIYTLRQLLQHTSGLGNYTARPEYNAAIERHEAPWTDADLLGRLRLNPFLFAPGQGWSYSNTGYFLVRRLIERAAKADIDTALQTLVLSRLGIERTRIARSIGDMDACAWGNPQGYHPGWVFHGLLIGPPAEAALFMHRLLRGDLLPPELRAAMLEPRKLDVPLEGRPWSAAGYGLGLMMATAAGVGAALGHSGQGPGSVAAVWLFPELDPPRTVASFAPTEDQAMVERAALQAADVTRHPEEGGTS
jgi:D-alanyl-D-alanine carboxypeptidase